jgi:hypothetical protein
MSQMVHPAQVALRAEVRVKYQLVPQKSLSKAVSAARYRVAESVSHHAVLQQSVAQAAVKYHQEQ